MSPKFVHEVQLTVRIVLGNGLAPNKWSRQLIDARTSLILSPHCAVYDKSGSYLPQ